MILFFLIFLKSLRIFERDSDESYVLTHWGGGHNFQRAFLRVKGTLLKVGRSL